MEEVSNELPLPREGSFLGQHMLGCIHDDGVDDCVYGGGSMLVTKVVMASRRP